MGAIEPLIDSFGLSAFFVGVAIGQPIDLVFTPLDIAAVAAAVGISALIALDGGSTWLEGALLMLLYAILAVSFFEFV